VQRKKFEHRPARAAESSLNRACGRTGFTESVRHFGRSQRQIKRGQPWADPSVVYPRSLHIPYNRDAVLQQDDSVRALIASLNVTGVTGNDASSHNLAASVTPARYPIDSYTSGPDEVAPRYQLPVVFSEGVDAELKYWRRIHPRSQR